MNIREHFSKMFIALGWFATGCVVVYGVLFTISQLWDIMWNWAH